MNFKKTITAGEVETTIDALDQAIKQKIPDVKWIFIEAEKSSVKNA